MTARAKRRGGRRRATAIDRVMAWLLVHDRNQVWLAAQLGIQPPHMSLILSGARGLSLKMATRLEAITKIKATDFVREDR